MNKGLKNIIELFIVTIIGWPIVVYADIPTLSFLYMFLFIPCLIIIAMVFVGLFYYAMNYILK